MIKLVLIYYNIVAVCSHSLFSIDSLFDELANPFYVKLPRMAL